MKEQRLIRVAESIFRKIVKMIPDGEDYFKLNNSELFMPLVVERLHTTKVLGIEYTVFSFAHYYEQNGDLVPDPDMTFYCNDTEGIFPATFQNAYRYDEAITGSGNAVTVQVKLMQSLSEFANVWMCNLKAHQGIE